MKWLANFWRGVVARFEAARHYSEDRSRLRDDSLQSARMDYSCSDRELVQRKSRFFVDNTGIGSRLATVFQTYVSGGGLQLMPASSDSAYNAFAKEVWEAFSEMPDIGSRLSMGQIQGLWARHWFKDGGCFVLKTYFSDTKRPGIQNFESHLCQTPPDQRLNENVHDGVVMAPGTMRPTGYYFVTEKRDGTKVFGAPKSADFVIHVWDPERIGQIREVPLLTPVLNEVHDLDDLRLLEMRAAKEEAKTVNIIKNATGELKGGALRRQRYAESTTINTGATVSENRSQFVSDALGGETVAMKPNEDLVRMAGVRPSKASIDYWQHLKEEICIGADIPYVLVYPDSMQGTVYRGSLDMAAANFRACSAVIAAATKRVYEYVIDWEWRNNPQFRATPRPKDWKKVKVSAPRSPNVDIGRNSKALIEELKNGLTNFDLAYGPQGQDWGVEIPAFEEQLNFIEDKCPRVWELLKSQNPPPPDPNAEAEDREKRKEEDAIPA